MTAYRAALQEWTRERVPLQWAMTQNNLGNALSSARRAGERHGAAGGGGRRLPRGAAGADPRAGAAGLGDDPEQPRQRACEARRAGERHGAPGGGGRRLSRGAAGVDPRAGAAAVGDDPEQPRHRASEARRAGERHRAAGGGGRRLSRGAAGADPRAGAAGLGRRPRTTSATRFGRSASGRAAPRAWRRRSRPFARRCRSGPASGCRCSGPTTQNNLGTALRTLGERTKDDAKLREARTAISAAFEVFMQAGQEQYRDYFEDRLREIDKQIAALQARQ